jgi:hypothetical protein
MIKQNSIKYLIFSVQVIFVVIPLLGTNACREDYELGANTSVAQTPSPSPTGTVDDDDDIDDDPTPTPNPLGSPTVTSSLSPIPGTTASPSATISGTETVLPTVTVTQSVVGLLSLIEQNSNNISTSNTSPATSPSNWLGQAYTKNTPRPEREVLWQDSDEDGFCDTLELEKGTNILDANSFPEIITTSLLSRIKTLDRDVDGLSDAEELILGTNPNQQDTDSDKCPDGIEVLSGSDPLVASKVKNDLDKDCLSQEAENSLGTSTNDVDTDGDFLADSAEYIIGSDPLAIDTDGDCISDYREFMQGSDPRIAER